MIAYRFGEKVEVDLVLEVGQRLVPIEIKFSGTLDRSWGRGIQVFKEVAGLPKESTGYVISTHPRIMPLGDGVIAVLFPGAISSFAKQFRASGIKAELIGIETFEDESEVKASAGALEGAWYVNASDPTETFIWLYKKKFKQHPGWGVANAFDTLNLLVQGVIAGQQTPEQMRDFLRGVKDFSGAAGVYSASGDNRFTLPAALKLIRDGEFLKLR